MINGGFKTRPSRIKLIDFICKMGYQLKAVKRRTLPLNFFAFREKPQDAVMWG